MPHEDAIAFLREWEPAAKNLKMCGMANTPPLDDPKTIGARIALMRSALGLTQAEACRMSGIEPNTWNQYEKGVNRISLDKAALLCDAFHVTLDWLYRGNASGLPFSFAARLREMAS